MDLPTQPLSPTSQENENLLQNQKTRGFKIPLHRTEWLQGCWRGKKINSLATSKRVKQFSKNKITFVRWAEVILENVFPESRKDTLMWVTSFRCLRADFYLSCRSQPKWHHLQHCSNPVPPVWFRGWGLPSTAHNRLRYKCLFNFCSPTRSCSLKGRDCNFSPVFWHNAWRGLGVL